MNLPMLLNHFLQYFQCPQKSSLSNFPLNCNHLPDFSSLRRLGSPIHLEHVIHCRADAQNPGCESPAPLANSRSPEESAMTAGFQGNCCCFCPCSWVCFCWQLCHYCPSSCSPFLSIMIIMFLLLGICICVMIPRIFSDYDYDGLFSDIFCPFLKFVFVCVPLHFVLVIVLILTIMSRIKSL